VLDQLGWHYSVQVKSRYTGTGHRKPDYALTASTESAQALTNQIYAPAELRDAGVLAVADAKKWAWDHQQSNSLPQLSPCNRNIPSLRK